MGIRSWWGPGSMRLVVNTWIFSLKIAQNKRITLPDKIMKQLNVNDGDLLVMKLGTAGKAEVKRFDSDLVKF